LETTAFRMQRACLLPSLHLSCSLPEAKELLGMQSDPRLENFQRHHDAELQVAALAKLVREAEEIGFFLEIQAAMLGRPFDASALPHSTQWYRHLLFPEHTESDVAFVAPRDQHAALMHLHHLSKRLNAFALECECRAVDRVVTSQRPLAASAPESSWSSAPPLTGRALVAHVEALREQVQHWATERAELQERVARAEAELEALHEQDLDTTLAVDDASVSAAFREVRDERVRVQAHADTLRRLLALPL
jgi:hypothetical protein